MKDQAYTFRNLENRKSVAQESTEAKNIRYPYIQQYKNFEQRLENPRLKSHSHKLRKVKQSVCSEKENAKKYSEPFEKGKLLEQTRRIVSEKLPIDYFSQIAFQSLSDIGQSDKQEALVSRFREKIHGIKILNSNSSNCSSDMWLDSSLISRRPLTEIDSAVGTQRNATSSVRTVVKNFDGKFRNVGSRNSKSFFSIKQRCPLNFISYKTNKNLTDQFNQQSLKR